MIEIKNRYTGKVLYMAKNAQDVRQAVEEGAREGANLSGADLRDAYLRDANLHGADLRCADLRDANLRGADLQDAVSYRCGGWDPRGWHFRATLHDDGPWITAGCRCFTVAQAREHWRDNPDALARVEVLALLGS